MVTTAGTQTTDADLVDALMSLEHDAMKAYDSAIERLEDASSSAKIAEFKTDHERHLRELGEFARSIGVTNDGGSMKSVLTSGKVAMADLAGDGAILKAMATNEEDTITAYERGSTQNAISPELQQICARAHADGLPRAGRGGGLGGVGVGAGGERAAARRGAAAVRRARQGGIWQGRQGRQSRLAGSGGGKGRGQGGQGGEGAQEEDQGTFWEGACRGVAAGGPACVAARRERRPLTRRCLSDSVAVLCLAIGLLFLAVSSAPSFPEDRTL